MNTRKISIIGAPHEGAWRLHLVELVQALQISSSQVVADPETGYANHVIQYRLTSMYETPCLGLGKYSKNAGYFQAAVDRYAAAALLIHE